MQLDGNFIYLRPVQKEDLPFFVGWLSDSEVNQYTSGRSYSMQEECTWFESVQSNRDEMVFSIFLKSSNEIIGNCAIHFRQQTEDAYAGKTSVGLMIGEKKEWGKGYGMDTVRTLLNYLKHEWGEREVYLTVFCENLGAHSMLRKMWV